MTGIYDGLARFIEEHRTCGGIIGDAGPLSDTGYRLWLRCPCGAAFDVWVTEEDAAADLVYSAMLTLRN